MNVANETANAAGARAFVPFLMLFALIACAAPLEEQRPSTKIGK